MSSHFKWYPSTEEVVVPWNARYSFPSQSNKAIKITPRIPPKNGAIFRPTDVIRVEFLAQGYVNPINTTFEFDVTITMPGALAGGDNIRFQNNIQSIFNRVRLLYGSTPLEDIIDYNVIVRSLTEWTSTNQTSSMDQTSISEGIGGLTPGYGLGVPTHRALSMVNARQHYIQGLKFQDATNNGSGSIPNNSLGNSGASGVGCTRRYQINLALGLLTQDKLIPVKFMASQLAIELALESAANCMISNNIYSGVSTTTTASYVVSNFNMIPEILEFDASYDAMFLKGLQQGGVPIKFSTWHTFNYATGGQSNVNLMIQERSRSVKALFALQTRNQGDFSYDNGATMFDTGSFVANASSSMQSYQWRIGGRYFPAQPVQLSLGLGSSVNNGGAEALVELQKALNIVGDYRLSASINANRWAVAAGQKIGFPLVTLHNEYDYTFAECGDTANVAGSPNWVVPRPFVGDTTSANLQIYNDGSIGSNCFASAIDLETSNGIEISGLNAEEQSDISFIANWSKTQNTDFGFTVFSYFDSMLILRENNVLELIQ